jgi:hypothetical protein
LWFCAVLAGQRTAGGDQPGRPGARAHTPQFQTAENCLACHNSLTAASGEDVSIGSAWRGSIMANSSGDRGRVLELPYADGADARKVSW